MRKIFRLTDSGGKEAEFSATEDDDPASGRYRNGFATLRHYAKRNKMLFSIGTRKDVRR